MARKSQEMRRIEAREAELRSQIAADEAELARKRAEMDELVVARRVLSRLSSAGQQDEPDAVEQTLEESEGPSDDDNRPVDGQNLTIGEMALVLLEQADPKGLTSNEILELIKQRWMPNLARTSLSPPLSRLKKRGQINQVGDDWRIIPGNGVSTG